MLSGTIGSCGITCAILQQQNIGWQGQVTQYWKKKPGKCCIVLPTKTAA
jgi:hypothetical protein